MNKKMQFSIWYFIFAFIILLFIQNWISESKKVELNYSDFKKALSAHQVSNIVIGKEIISGSITASAIKTYLPAEQAQDILASKDTQYHFKTIRVEDPDLNKDLQNAKISYQGELESTFLNGLISFGLPFILIILLWSYIFSRGGAGGGLMAIGKSKAKIYVENDIKINFSNVAGIDEAVDELKEVVAFLKTPEKFTHLGGRLPKGILLVGAPGTGKTLLARAVAGEAKVPFFSLSGSEFVEMFVGVGAARVRDLFQQALAMAPCIIFIDELDALGRARGINPVSSNEEREQTLNQLLAEMDGFDPNAGVVLMGATNRPEILDPALLRAGRFDRHVVVDKPDVVGREAILRIHVANLVLSNDVNLKIIAARTPGFVGADLANIVNEAALLAARTGKDKVEMSDFEEAIDRVITGLPKKSQIMTPEEKHRVAVHESGHALVTCYVKNADPIRKISIIPRGISALGFTQQTPSQDRHLYTYEEIMDRLAVLLGGRVAEEIIFGDISTGATDDLQKATEMVRSCLIEYGMSKTLGPVAFNLQRSTYIPTTFTEGHPDYSSETAIEVDREMRQLLEQIHKRVYDLLNQHKNELIKVAEKLEEKEIIDGVELKELLQN